MSRFEIACYRYAHIIAAWHSRCPQFIGPCNVYGLGEAEGETCRAIAEAFCHLWLQPEQGRVSRA